MYMFKKKDEEEKKKLMKVKSEHNFLLTQLEKQKSTITLKEERAEKRL